MDLIEKQDAIDAIKKCRNESDMPDMWYDGMSCALRCIYQLPSAQPKSYREGYQAGFKDAQPECAKDFVMLKVIDLNGRPYYSIIYLEDGREYEGYSSYDLKVISEYLKRYFGFAQPEIIRCRECVWHSGNHVCRNKNSIPWNDDDFCSWAERREVSE